MTKFELSARFFLQLAVILLMCRAVGWLGRRFLKQPQVVGEMMAGVIMGPSIGVIVPAALAPLVAHWQQALFPPESLPVLFVVSQLGLALYMFVVGMDFRVDLVRARLRSAIGISLAGICAPFLLGAAIATSLAGQRDLFAPAVGIPNAMLFLGAAMSITAFPMLARIIFECGLSGTRLGSLALAAGSIDDAACWGVLAVVLASFSGQMSVALWAIGGGIGYAVFAWLVLRPLLGRVGAAAESESGAGGTALVLVLAALGGAAWFTDMIGLYAVFGAFILGIAMPRGAFAETVTRQLEPVATHLLLPLFFVFSGLNTKLGLVDSWRLWGLTALIVTAAVVGKGGACWLAARISGESNADALGIGTLMNSRGLMELIILNIGLQRGIITPTLFTIMVVMAILTTLMTAPVFEWVYRRRSVPILATAPA